MGSTGSSTVRSKPKKAGILASIHAYNMFTLANLLTLLGLLLTIFGSFMLNTWTGLILILTGRFLDFLDGRVARKISTVSRFGANFDPIADKLATLFILLGLWRFDYIPKWLIVLALTTHLAISIVNIVSLRLNKSVAVNKMGKIGMFILGASLVGFIAAGNLSGISGQLVLGLSYLLSITALLFSWLSFFKYALAFQR